MGSYRVALGGYDPPEDDHDQPPAFPANATWMTIRLPSTVLSTLKRSTPPQPITFCYTGQSNNEHVLTLGKDQYVVTSHPEDPDGNEIFRRFDAHQSNSPSWFIEVGKVYSKLKVNPKPNIDAATKIKNKSTNAVNNTKPDVSKSSHAKSSSSAGVARVHSSSSEEEVPARMFIAFVIPFLNIFGFCRTVQTHQV
jgi:hypothetical protein